MGGPNHTASTPSEIIDLHDLGALLNYERASTDPRFRHAKLRDVATCNEFRDAWCLLDEWHLANPFQRLGLIYDRSKAKHVRYRQRNQVEPDLPTNMLAHPAPPSLQRLTPRQLETIYWQTRNHDGAFKAASLLRHFLDLLPPCTRIRVCTGPSMFSPSRALMKRGSNLKQGDEEETLKLKPTDYLMLAKDCKIMEFILARPHELTLSAVLPDSQTYMTGGLPTALHCVVGLASDPAKTRPDTILDLSSLQFGEAGRGDNDTELFVLEPVEDFEQLRLPKYAYYNTFDQADISEHVAPKMQGEDTLDMAKRAKKRYDNRDKVPFCSFCGGPPQNGTKMTACSSCKMKHYCTQEHQLRAWDLHRHSCERS